MSADPGGAAAAAPTQELSTRDNELMRLAEEVKQLKRSAAEAKKLAAEQKAATETLAEEVEQLKQKHRLGSIALALEDVFYEAQTIIAAWSDPSGGKASPSRGSPTATAKSTTKAGSTRSGPSVVSGTSDQPSSPRNNDMESEARDRVKQELEGSNTTPLFDSPNQYVFEKETLMMGHLIKRQYLAYFSTAECDVFSKKMSPMAALLGPYSRDAREKNRKQSKSERAAAAASREHGGQLLQWSFRNILRMPKALEKSMDSAFWVLEPVLRDECGANDWLPTMWRFRCLDDEQQINVSLRSSGQLFKPKAPPLTEFPDCEVAYSKGYGCEHLWPLKNFHGRVFHLERDDVSLRALVFVYLLNLWQRFLVGGPRDRQKLQEGVERVDQWVKDTRDFMDSDAPALSLQRLEEWLSDVANLGAPAAVADNLAPVTEPAAEATARPAAAPIGVVRAD